MVREKARSKIEAHVSGVCLREKGGVREVLLGRRADWREIFPGRWECGGGQVATNQSFSDAVRSHLLEEFGLGVEVIAPFCTYEISMVDGSIIPGVRFVCIPTEGGMVNIDQNQIVESSWVEVGDLSTRDLIPGLGADIEKADRLWNVLRDVKG